MGIFGNTQEGVGAMVGPGPERGPGIPSGFDAMGYPVPMFRRAAAYEHLKDMGITDPETRWTVVQVMSDRLGRDQPMAAMEEGVKHVDVTGVYRIMAVLLTAEKPRVRVKAVTRRMEVSDV